MKVFVDNDVAVKLAKWGLLKRFGQHLTKQGRAELFMVPTLKYRFKLDDRAKAVALLGSGAAVDQLTDFAVLCKPVKGHSAEVAKALAGVPSVDAGEATLFAAAASFDAALVDTGDKKALRSLGALGAEHLAVAALSSKVACLEQTMSYLIGRWSFDVVREAVAATPCADASTARCISGATEGDALAALNSKIDELRPACAGILCVAPFGWVPV